MADLLQTHKHAWDGIFPDTDFIYDTQTNTYQCPPFWQPNSSPPGGEPCLTESWPDHLTSAQPPVPSPQKSGFRQHAHWMWPRQLWGYSRLENARMVPGINRLSKRPGARCRMFSASHQAGGKASARQPVGAAARPTANGVSAVDEQRSTDRQETRSLARLVREPGSVRPVAPD